LFYFFEPRVSAYLSKAILISLAPSNSADCFFLSDAAKFALGDVPTFASNGSNDAALGYLFVKSSK
jgi:hypothetical protein